MEKQTEQQQAMLANMIEKAESFVQQQLEHDHSGHDWFHIDRVRKLALEIAAREGADLFICELAALLHDVADEKLNDSKQAGLDKVEQWLCLHVSDPHVVTHVKAIIATMSYNGGKNPPMETLEGQVVQDADRLDALGAIGIARTFMYAGSKGSIMHHPDKDFSQYEYRAAGKSAIYHFYEKLLKLKDLMNTAYAKEMAVIRHQWMEMYLEQFYKEWNVDDIKRKGDDSTA
ncbi:HD domain-containing protein [Paenibacillus farraposensis]|uniref:HD domain-containing protein n=1 Tax=Paenibacillus farraposensis TaxID=2807095 RepID=A0ABW4DB26_9BACL|nr:HD domain-containing protein [Paenibacillus farraposensis]MCC3381791.1 HD domain-containing protein [Paenibacillus farraposensis]